MSKQTVYFDFEGTAVITVTDAAPDDLLTRCDETWRDTFYPLFDTSDIYEHWTYNAAANGITDISELDGWADVEPGAVTLSIEDLDTHL